MHFVDSDLLAELVELAEKTRKQVNNLLRLVSSGELCEADHVGVEECYVFKRVNHTLIVQNALQYVLWHQFFQQFLRLFDFNLNDPLLVVLTTHLHLAAMRG